MDRLLDRTRASLKALLYRINRRLIRIIIAPRVAGMEPDLIRRGAESPDDPPGASAAILYVLETRSLSDLIVLDIVCEQVGLPAPLSPIEIVGRTEQRRFVFLHRASHGPFQPNTMKDYSQRLVHLLDAVAENPDPPGVMIPVGVYWGRAPNREGSLWRQLFSENRAVTSRLKRLVNLFVSRNDIVVHFGVPLTLAELAAGGGDGQRLRRRAARLLRVRLRNQRVATMGPDLSHRRTIGDRILQSRAVRARIEAEDDARSRARLEKQAQRYVREIASNLSYTTVRVLEQVLRWFWNRIYQGVRLHGYERLIEVAEAHTVIYVPSHRSHLDYLLLSYLLYQRGLMIPHIAAGENLDLPVLGGILRRGGAFFMRRSFREDPLYAAVFSEYLYQAYRRGHSVEFFPEGGRTRTGRLLPARLGLLKMTLEHHQRGVPRPLALVPVYFGYEKLVEARSYLDELKGAEKKRESLADLFSGLALIRQNFGVVDVQIGAPLVLGEWLAQSAAPFAEAADAAPQLGREVMLRINDAAVLNGVNMVALVMLCTPKLAIEESALVMQIDCYLDLLTRDRAHHRYVLPEGSAGDLVRRTESLGLLSRESQPFGDVLSLGPVSAVLMTWYRNNVAHTLALPSLIACLIRDRRRPLRLDALKAMTETVFPYIAGELQSPETAAATERWLEHMAATGLLLRGGDDTLTAPLAATPEHARLRLLAKLILPTLERLYIVMERLSQGGQRTQTRETLQARSHRVAQKMSRLYGLNAPEFFDARLFNEFVDALIDRAVVSEGEDGALTWAPVVTQVLKASESVIDPDFRLAVRQEEAGAPAAGDAAGAAAQPARNTS